MAAVALVCGCAETRKHMGGAAENDHNVLTGGPVTGTTLKDLPEPVKDTLKTKAPNAEVADIDKQTMNGKTVYKVTFGQPGKNPALYIAEDGTVQENPNAAK